MCAMTDYEKWTYGILKLEETWFYKKALGFAERVRSGEFGFILKESKKSDGWDTIKYPCFTVIRKNKLEKLITTESGVFKESKTGGRYNISIQSN